MKLLPPPPHQGMPCLLACLPLPPPCRYIRKETAIPRHTTSSSTRTTLSMTVSIYLLPPLLPRPLLPSFSLRLGEVGGGKEAWSAETAGDAFLAGAPYEMKICRYHVCAFKNNWAKSAKCTDVCTDCADFKGKRLGKIFPSFSTLHAYSPGCPPSPPLTSFPYQGASDELRGLSH